MQQAIVEAHGLVKTFKRADGTPVKAVDGVDLTIEKGEIFSLLGPNGAGKTTTISMISGLLKPTAGDAKIGGYSITTEPLKAKALMGIVPQEIALYPTLSARANLRFFGQLYDLSGAELDQRIDEVLDIIDLGDRQKDRIDTFSGGMKRRVNIGVGLLHRPQLIYMDEPTVGVDPQSRRRILDTVLRLREEYGMTVLYTTHLMEEAQELSDRVAIIDHGKIIASGTQVELMAQTGEVDRLILTLGQPEIAPALVARFKSDLSDVVNVVVEPREADDAQKAETRVTIFSKRGRKSLPEVLQLANALELHVVSVQVREPDLEALFLQLTGRELRE
jgi:ABC-2 type transport system ATP-binding protein